MPLEFSKANSPTMFDAIARRYDFVNGFISLGQHRRWRQAMAAFLPERSTQRVLDLATGTGDVALTLTQDPRVAAVVGVDLSESMLAIGRVKIAKQGLNQRISLEAGDAQNLRFAEASFDAVTMAFGIRNVPDPSRCLSEAYRVLKPGGRMIILESARPSNAGVRFGNNIYVRWIIPWLGGLLSGHRGAYRYLNQTILAFPSGADFASLMSRAGFRAASFKPLMRGSVHLYWGSK